MIDRMETMPGRDIEHGEESRAANALRSCDIQWLAEAVEARGGTKPNVDARVMRAADLRGIYDDMDQFPYRWIDPTYSPSAQHASGWVDFGPETINAPEAEAVRKAASTIAAGQPMLGKDMRTAFYNCKTHEVALFGKYSDPYTEDGITWENVGTGYWNRGHSEVLIKHYYANPAGGVAPYSSGCRITGGRFLFDRLSDIPHNAKDWKIETTFAIVGVTRTGAGNFSAIPATASFVPGTTTLEMDAMEVIRAAEAAFAAHGITMGETDSYWSALWGAIVMLRVPENYMLSDLGWSFKP